MFTATEQNIALPYACPAGLAQAPCLLLVNVRLRQPQPHPANVLFQSGQLQVILAGPESGGTDVTAWE